MKVLFILPYCSFPEILSDSLPYYLIKKGHEVTVAFYSRVREKNTASKIGNIPFHRIDGISFSIPYYIEEFPCFLHLEDVVKRLSPDIIHVNNLPFLSSFQSILTSKKVGVPSILHVHGVIGMRNKILNIAQYVFISTFMRKAFHVAGRVICLTKSDSFEIQKLGCPREKIRIVPNGVDVEKFKPCKEIMDNVIFWHGRFVPEKGLNYLIMALNLVVKEKPKVKLVMCGRGPMLPKILCLVKKFGLEKNVVFKGCVERDKLPSLLGSAQLYVLPSLKEGMPYALLEAMSCGLPVVGSNIPGINDVIINGENGFLVPVKNSEALADAILTLLSDAKLRRKLGQNARKLIVEKYDWNKIVEKVEKVYYEAIREMEG
ncbi:glycosyltransferase family 4 protein [Saccharolobus sp.]|uniref:glycosyltransferase family 4 protein n=1 Tax=Saccharolobus sp. TaxID=2100761 RepID=UPI003170DC29